MRDFTDTKRVMFVLCPTIGGSGIQVFHERLASSLEPLGVESKVVTLSPRWEFFPWGLKMQSQLMGDARQRIQLVHTSSEYGVLLPRKAPLLVTLHHCSVDPEVLDCFSWPVRWHHRSLLKSFLRKTIHSADRVNVISHYTRQSISEALQEDLKIEVIYLGLDANRFSPAHCKEANQDGKIRLFYSGNPSRRKGFDLLDPLMEKLGGDFQLEYTTGLRHSNARLQAANTKCLGVLQESALIRAINRADIILQPSRREGFGLSILEGMACSKPVVSTACSSIPEVLEHGKGGILCEPGSVDQLETAIRKLAQSPDLRLRMGFHNRQRVLDQFSHQKMAARYWEVYQSLCLGCDCS
jgi:L-malate glycosyltransferase